MYAKVFKGIRVYVYVCKGMKDYDNKYIVVLMLTKYGKYQKNIKYEESKVVFTQYP